MAREIKVIKDEMTAEFISNPAVVEKYGLDTEKSFDAQFSKASIESILFYVFAFCAWTVEKLFDTHKAEVTNYIDEMKPHSLRWYVNKVKEFRFGQSLIPDTDQYDDTGLTDKDIAKMQIVKYASAEETNGKLYIKVAKDGAEGRTPLSQEEEDALSVYINEVKDAGVKISVRNAPAVKFCLNIEIYYDPQVLDGEGNSHISGGTPVVDAIKDYIKNLPFNGEYRNVDLVDKLQKVPGVIIPELYSASFKIQNATEYTQIVAKEKPFSGYFEFVDNDSQIKYTAYAGV